MSERFLIKEVIDSNNSKNVVLEEDGLINSMRPFRPVKCTQSDLDTNRIQSINGYVYFTMDTQKIYYGTGTEFISMGGSSGILYASKTFGEEDSDDTSFAIEDFDDQKLPNNINDLIINVGANIKRNGFYQVVEILPEEGIVLTRFLPVGGGSNSSSTDSSGGDIKIEYVSPKSDAVLAGEDYYIEFTVEAVDSSGDLVATGGTATWIVNGKRYPGGILKNGKNNINRFNIGPYLTTDKETNEIKLSVSADTGGSINTVRTKSWSIAAINLNIEWPWEYSPNNYVSQDAFTLYWTPIGNIPAQAHIWFDNDIANATVVSLPSGKMGTQQTTTFSSLPYGVHNVSMQLSATLDDGATYQTKIITRALTFIKDGNIPLLTVPFYQTEATQYDTVKIEFLAYNPSQSEETVEVLVNGNVVSTNTYDRALQSISYTFGVSGTIDLMLRIKDTTIQWSTSVQVKPLQLGVSETAGAAFRLKASDFIANDGLMDLSEKGLVTFSDNFDWANGGLKDEVDEYGHYRKYICVKNGTRMTINHYPFSDSGVQYGKDIKIIFKTANCYDYNAEVLKCWDTSTGRGVGLTLNAQNATFSSNETEIVTQYCEDSYIELEAEIWPASSAKNPDNFMMFWVDGIPSAIKAYSKNADFSHITAKPIVIGSDNCDVHIYMVKTYNRKLNEEEHLNNFIADAPSVEEMLARYDRNDILNANNEISYAKLVEKNPNCRAHIYTIPRMTYKKDDKVGGCAYAQYYKDGSNPIVTAENVEIRVQGTSSAAYGVAAFNIDSKFKNGFTDASGNNTPGWSITDTAIPVDYFCTKVNVASCENTNNAINQEWYNEFQPYWDAHRRKTYAADPSKKYRDTMEFSMGVLFMEDHNQKTSFTNNTDYPHSNIFSDTPGYAEKPFPKQYSICNMGNSKKNVEVFHDLDNPKACCVEVCDNQKAEQWMTTSIDVSTFDLEEPYFEFRYPDGNDKALDSQKEAWVRLVNWMAENNPAAATGNPLPEGKSFAPYTFRGFSPPGFEDEDSPTGISLAGTTIHTYSTRKTVQIPVLDDNGQMQYDDNGNLITRTETRDEPYTHDTYEYRMAKMLSECEDYLVMDSVVYHYLFIERHTMVDNVAKNTFWSSEDLIHWDMTRDYDNDTADGNNNTGYLVYTYGLECLDQETDTKFVFNAKDSVWLQFVHGLKEAQKELYSQLAGYKGASGKYPGAWDEETYLKKHNEWQSSIPERCWIYDYFRKYIRPRRLGMDQETYLHRLEGGKKTHQRKQYETYHRYYLDSKYQTGKAHTSRIDLRSNSGNAAFAEDYVTPITTYIDCYPYMSIGGQTFTKRIKRGEVCDIPIGKLVTNASDATTYFFCGSMIQSMGNLQYLYPSYATLDAAIKLRDLELGSDDPGYRNNNLQSADFSSNIMLESAKIQNSGNLGDTLSALDLSALTSLRELRLNGSTYAGVILPPAGILETAYINGVHTLEMDSLDKLTTLVFDDSIYANLNTLKVVNCPKVNTYDLIMQSNLTRYYLTNVNWIVPNNGVNTSEDGTITSIKILEHLLRRARVEGETSCEPVNGQSTQTALTGTIYIDAPGLKVDEYAIYDKYHKTFPNLTISYNNEAMTVNKAVSITFYKSDEENSDILYHVLAPKDNLHNLAYLTSFDGPAGKDMGTPSRNDTSTQTFAWNLTAEDNDWIITTTNSSGNKEVAEYTHSGMQNIIPKQPFVDYQCVPKFTPITRKYSVVLKDDNETIIDHEYEDGVPNGTIIHLPRYLYKPHSVPGKRWGFKGWISAADHLSGTRAPTFIATVENNSTYVTENFYAYAFYTEEDAATTPMSSVYFQTGNTVSTSIGLNISYTPVKIHRDYANILQGPITFPSSMPGVSTALGISGCDDSAPGVTDIYLPSSGNYKVIGAKSCTGLKFPGLKTFHMNDKLQVIGDDAFRDAFTLEKLTWSPNLVAIGSKAFCTETSGKTMQVKILDGDLSDTITTIGASCFYNGGGNILITNLPASLEELNAFTFYNCPGVAISEFGSDDETKGLKKIGGGCLAGAGITQTVSHIYVHDSVKHLLHTTNLGLNAPGSTYSTSIFYGYSVGSLKTVNMGHAESDYQYGSSGAYNEIAAENYEGCITNFSLPTDGGIVWDWEPAPR